MTDCSRCGKGMFRIEFNEPGKGTIVCSHCGRILGTANMEVE